MLLRMICKKGIEAIAYGAQRYGVRSDITGIFTNILFRGSEGNFYYNSIC